MLIRFVWPTGEGNGETKAAVPTVQTPQSWCCRDGPADDQCLQRFLQSLPLITFLPTDYEYHLLFRTNTGETGPMVTTTLKLGISILNGGNSEVQRVCILDIYIYIFFSINLGYFSMSFKLTGTFIYGISFFFVFRKCWNTWRIRRM